MPVQITGTGPPSFAVSLPFTLPPDNAFKPDELPMTINVGSQSVEIEIERERYLATAQGFPTEGEAQLFLQRLGAALVWLTIHNQLGVLFDLEVVPPRIYAKPIIPHADTPIAGIVNSHGWAAFDGEYETNKTSIIPRGCC